MFKVILRPFGAFPIISNFVSRKRWVVEEKGGEKGVRNTHMDTFYFVGFKVILRSFGILVSNDMWLEMAGRRAT